MNIVFMGTPGFAVASLKKLIENNYNIQCVVTQPDKPKGRGHKLTLPPVKELALEHELEVLQPMKIKNNEDFLDRLTQFEPDVIVVVAYGKILPSCVLNIPKYGCINVHASLLPKYRGAAPIQWAVINGEKITGVTTMYMDVGMDTGDIILKKETHIGDGETAGDMHDRLSVIGAEMLLQTLEMIKNGSIQAKPQNDSEATYAPLIEKYQGEIDWNDCSENIRNLVRGLNPKPGAYTFLEGKRIRIWKMDCIDIPSLGPGVIQKIEKDAMVVGTGKGSIVISELHPENARIMTVNEYRRGHCLDVGMVFGNKV